MAKTKNCDNLILSKTKRILTKQISKYKNKNLNK